MKTMLPSMLALVFALSVAGVTLPGCSRPEPAADSTQAQDSAPPKEAKAKPDKESACDDGQDEDGDGDTDCEDSDCAPTPTCEIARCKTVCSEIFKCDSITEMCTKKELAGVLAGCQSGCSTQKTRSQVNMADGVPCFMIGSVFLEQVQGQGICLGEKAKAGKNDAT